MLHYSFYVSFLLGNRFTSLELLVSRFLNLFVWTYIKPQFPAVKGLLKISIPMHKPTDIPNPVGYLRQS